VLGEGCRFNGSGSYLSDKILNQGIRTKTWEVVMESSSDAGWWLDRWFPLLVILFGLIFVSILVSFKPGA
jgi:hypothetical protein